jgi:hypothetical protein
MKNEITQINLVLAWLWLLLGFVSGMMLGLFFAAKTGLAATRVSNAGCIASATFRSSVLAR